MESDLPPEFEPLLYLLQRQPVTVRELFRYAIVLVMIDDEKARVVQTSIVDDKEWVTVRTNAGEVFQIIRPQLSVELEEALLVQIRRIVAEELGE